MFYLKQPISLNLNKFNNNNNNNNNNNLYIWNEHTNRRNADIAGIVYIYFWQIEHEVREFRLKKFNIQVQCTPPPKFYWQLKF